MSYLEDELKLALRREEPSADFADRILARLNRPAEPNWFERLTVLMQPPRIQWVAASLIISVLIPVAGLQYRRHQEGERAKAQLLFAVRIAGSKLHQAQKKVLEAGRMDTRL